MENKETIGVILARLQPIHNGHIALITRSFMENDQTYVFVGSADKFNQRNPIPINIRLQLAREAIETILINYGVSLPNHKIHIFPLDDLDDETNNNHEWGFYLYSKIVTKTNSANFTMYYSDGFEIITTWFPGFILRNNVSLSLLARNTCENGVSATEVRRMIMTDDEKLMSCVPECVYEMRDALKKYIELSSLIK